MPDAAAAVVVAIGSPVAFVATDAAAAVVVATG